MRTGIIGTGRIGSTLARILVAAGHEVLLANAAAPGPSAPYWPNWARRPRRRTPPRPPTRPNCWC